MRGLVEEAQQEQQERDKGPVLDLVIIASLQRIEHYEIAAYGTMAELAGALGRPRSPKRWPRRPPRRRPRTSG